MKHDLFGGPIQNLERYFGDLWEWDGSEWNHVERMLLPSARLSPAMTYDPQRERIVLFGGNNSKVCYNDTWEWDGTTFVQVADDGPEPRATAAIAYDVNRKKIVLYGVGTDFTENFNYVRSLSDTWEWDGIEWKEIDKEGTGSRVISPMIYDIK